jgi:large subunit ribosomal protein L18
MATKIRSRTSRKQSVRFKHKSKIRSRVEGTSECPRLSVFRSNKHLYVQLIDDSKGRTLAAASSADESLTGKKAGKSLEAGKAIGALIAKRALAKNLIQVVFDRGGYLYHGRVKAIADGAREAGLKF